MRHYITLILLTVITAVSIQREAQSQQSPQRLAGPQGSHQLWMAPPARVVKMEPATKAREIRKDHSSEAYSEIRKSAQAVVDLPGTTALALIDAGVVVYEGYGLSKGASAQGRFASYSVAKSVTALAVGEAFCAGKIKVISLTRHRSMRLN
jgi:CubicO group peptidase (beta-lactamase class C family)